MRKFNMTIQSIKILLTFVVLSLTSACGGGGGSGTPPNDPPDTTPPPTGGITRTGVAFASGPVTGFGSVIVNGVHYDTSSASFTKDGINTTQDDLSVGHHVVVKGTIDDDNSNAVATSVDFNDNVEGPVSSVNTVANTIVVLGQTVQLGPETSIDDSCPATIGGLLSVAAVEVSGLVDASGVIAATRIECKSVLGEMEVTGTVSGLNSSAMTFQINALVVDYSAAAMDNFPGTITNGDPVEAKGVTLGASGELIATRVEFKGALFDDNAGDHIEIEGFITSFTSETQFDVNGIPVTTSTSTTFEGGAATDLGLNLKVEVEGEFDAAGTLVATKVEIKQAKVVRVTGLVDSVAGNSLVILGITVTTDSILTRFEDKSAADRDPLTMSDINTGDYIEVRGQEFPAGSGELAAALLERDDPRARTELRGFVQAGGVNRPSLTVLGVTIDTDGSTVYRDVSDQVMTADDFWAQVAEGSLVDTNGAEITSTSLLAEELSLEAAN
jgi:hypothetical protein